MTQIYINGKRVARMPKLDELEDGKWYSIAIVSRPDREKR